MIDKKRIIASLLTAEMIIAGLTGCKSKIDDIKSYVLEDTLLAKSTVATVDGNISILRLTDTNALSNNHFHYLDIINGEKLTALSVEACHCFYVRKCDNITIIGSISNYLTEEEMIKALDNGLTNEDICSILTRIKEEEKSKSLTLAP